MQPLIDIYQALIVGLRLQGLAQMWVDLDMGQLEADGVELPLQYPGILIKFDDVIWKDDVNDIQVGVVTISIKVIFKFQNEAEILVVQPNGRSEVIANFQLLGQVHQNILAIAGSTFYRFRRFNQYQLNPDPKNLIWVQVLQYHCNIKSDSTSPGAALIIDFDHIKNYNALMERRRFNLIHK